MSLQKEEESVWAEGRSYEDKGEVAWCKPRRKAPEETTAAKQTTGFQPPVPGQGSFLSLSHLISGVFLQQGVSSKFYPPKRKTWVLKIPASKMIFRTGLLWK